MLTSVSLRRLNRATSNLVLRTSFAHQISSRTVRQPNYSEIDAKWQKIWTQEQRAPASVPREKSYVLPMFAYPSGSLHMGHLRVYTISDVIARYRRMIGYEVSHPTGWDAFGLPAENAAIERGVNPAEWTQENIASMRLQLKSMNTYFDWDMEISTCSDNFYKHTQMLFLMLFDKGLAYQADALVNYDPVDKTVLANEQVDSNGRSWRSGAVVQQINLKQWFFRITAFKEALLEDLDHLAQDNKWPDRVISQQRNWLGRSHGARIRFDVETLTGEHLPVHVFTTRPDTIFGVKYLALSLSHPIVQQLAPNSANLQSFIAANSKSPPGSKAGFELPIKALNPSSNLHGDSADSLPVYTAPYVLDSYGEGAVMGVPGHDTRDLDFWKSNRATDTVPLVVTPFGAGTGNLTPAADDISEAYTDEGILTSLCGPYAGLDSKTAAVNIVSDLQRLGHAQPVESWRLRDWLISRQRYWGTPIPIIHCESCGVVPVPQQNLPVKLPVQEISLKGYSGNPLQNMDKWVNCDCPSCGGAARRETDTMDTFVDSSWYFLRFPDSKNESRPFSLESAQRMLPVDTYVGGVEHAILHLLYARFLYKFLASEGFVDGNAHHNEPFQQLIAQGMVHGKTLTDPANGRFLRPNEIVHTERGPLIATSQQRPVITWEKMSKSKYNGVDPASCIRKYGADATRAHILFAAPVGEVLQWDEEKIIGIERWFGRVSRLTTQMTKINVETSRSLELAELQAFNKLSRADTDALLLTQGTIKSVSQTFDCNIYSLNTVISDLTKFTNGLCDLDISKLTAGVAHESVSALLRMMAPIAPAFMEECWEIGNFREIYGGRSIFDCGWPKVLLQPDAESQLLIRRKEMTCAVQINGKLRFTTQVPVLNIDKPGPEDLKQHDARVVEAVLSSEPGQIWLKQKHKWDNRKKVLVIRGGKLVNIVF